MSLCLSAYHQSYHWLFWNHFSCLLQLPLLLTKQMHLSFRPKSPPHQKLPILLLSLDPQHVADYKSHFQFVSSQLCCSEQIWQPLSCCLLSPALCILSSSLSNNNTFSCELKCIWMSFWWAGTLWILLRRAASGFMNMMIWCQYMCLTFCICIPLLLFSPHPFHHHCSVNM